MSVKKTDEITAPAHYTGDGDVECKRALKSMMHPAKLDSVKSYWWGCAFKYLWRWPLKNGLNDLKKCRECLDNLIEDIESTAAPTGVLTERRS